MPERFEYPEQGWSTGKMRMAKAGPQDIMRSGKEFRELEGIRKRKEAEVSENRSRYPDLPEEEWSKFTATPPKGKAQAFDKDRPYYPDMVDTSNGFMMHKDHPQLKDLEDHFDFFNIPGGKGIYYFLKQKVPMAGQSSEWETG